MNAIRTCCILLAVIAVIAGSAFCPAGGGSSVRGQDGQPKELKGLKDTPTVMIKLGQSPNASFLLWSGHAVVLAQVALEPADKPDTFKGKIVKFERLSYDDKTKKYTHRSSPQIKKVPFECENGLTYTLLDGSKWELGSEFTVTKKNLRDRIEAIPEFGSDPRNPLQRVGWVEAEKTIDRVRPVPKK